MGERQKSRLLNILIIVAYLILPLIFFKDILRISELFFGILDVPIYTIPLRELGSELLKNFELPFWNSYIFSGFPLIANPQAHIFYPVTLLIDLFLPITLSYNISLLLHYSVAGIFLYLFLREYSLSKLSCFVGGVIFMFSGIMVAHRSHPQMIFSMVWFPLILLFVEKYRKSERFEYILIASILYSIAFLGGHTQMFLLGTIVLLLYIIYYYLIYSKLELKKLFKTSLLFLISAAIVCIQLIPSFELMLESIRETFSYTSFVEGSFQPKMILAIFFPFIFGGPYPVFNIPAYFGPFIYLENMIYFGLSTFVLLFMSFFSKNKHKRFWIFILIFSLSLVLGRYNPLYRIMYYVPIYNKFRIPARNWFQFGLAFSILSAIGFEYFFKNSIQRLKKVLIVSLSSIVFIFSSILFLLYSIKYNLFDGAKLLFNKINVAEIGFPNLITNIDIQNYAIATPIIIMCITLVFFLVSLIKKNKFIYGFLIILIFLDLLSFGHYYEENTHNDYLNASFKNYEDLKFLENEKDKYRIFSNLYNIAHLRIIPNMNSHYGLYSFGGYDPLILKDYNYITKIPDNPSISKNYNEILKNNLVLSKLNTKFIIWRKPEDLKGFMESINQIYYLKKDSKLVASEKKLDKAMIEKVVVDDDKEIIFNSQDHSLKLFQVPITLQEGKSYLISFKIRKESELDDYLTIDFYGEDYDNPEQETIIYDRDITNNPNAIQRIISINTLPDEDIYLRFFTFAKGHFIIEDFEVIEIRTKSENSYEIIYDDENYIILENCNVKERFYYSEKIAGVKSVEEVHSKYWGPIEFSEKESIYSTDLVQGIDIESKNYYKNGTINILDYKNNYVELKAKSEEEKFLVFTDTYYPGWKAYINGKETDVYRVNGVSKGIIVPEGEGHIVFSFRPSYFKILLVISLTSTVATSVFAIWLLVRNRTR